MRWDYRWCHQHEEEFCALLGLLATRVVRSYLEIGSFKGTSFYNVMANVVEPRGFGVMVDNDTGDHRRLRAEVAGELRARGYRAQAIEGNSRDEAIISKVRALGPFDLAFLDGDHSYEGTRADWINYGAMAGMVAFHDLALDGPARVWAEIDFGRKFEIRRVLPLAQDMNIGLLIR